MKKQMNAPRIDALNNCKFLGAWMAMLGIIAALVSGCSATDDGAPGSSGDTNAGAATRMLDTWLPEPTIRRVDPPALDAGQQKRADEAQQYLAKRYQEDGWRIVETTQTYVGDIIDWVDPSSVAGSQEQPPARLADVTLELAPGEELQRTELDLYPELRGPAGTIPFVRPRFEAYVRGETDATSVDDLIANHQVTGAPAGQDRLYTGMAYIAPNKAAASWVNAFGGTIESGTFSLLEMAVLCDGPNASTTQQMVGIAVSRDTVNFGDSVLRLQVEFLTAGPNTTGHGVGGWDGKSKGFVAVSGRPYGPGVALPGSTIFGKQYASRLEIQLFNGNWWVAHNKNWLGYYPGSLFYLMTSSACDARWYGEVFDLTPADWTWTDMGSGLFAAAGYGGASYFREPFYSTPSGTSLWPDGAFNVLPRDDACYTRTDLLAGATSGWGRYFFLGGPGGDVFGCD